MDQISEASSSLAIYPVMGKGEACDILAVPIHPGEQQLLTKTGILSANIIG